MRVLYNFVQWQKVGARVVCKDAEINSGFGAFYLPFHFLPLCRRIACMCTVCERLSRIHFGRRCVRTKLYFWMYNARLCNERAKPLYSSIYLNRFRLSHTHTHWSLVSGYWLLPVRAHSNQLDNEQKKNGKYIFGDRLKFTITITTCHITRKSTLFQSHLTYTYFHCIFL